MFILIAYMLIDLDNLLSAAQSFPNLNNSSNTSGGNTNSGQRQPSVLSLSQTMALSLTNSSDSEADFLESCHAQVLCICMICCGLLNFVGLIATESFHQKMAYIIMT